MARTTRWLAFYTHSKKKISTCTLRSERVDRSEHSETKMAAIRWDDERLIVLLFIVLFAKIVHIK